MKTNIIKFIFLIKILVFGLAIHHAQAQSTDIIITVKDGLTNEVIEGATIKAMADTTPIKDIIDLGAGRFKIRVPQKSLVEITAGKEGKLPPKRSYEKDSFYEAINININLLQSDSTTIGREVFLFTNSTVVFQNINFETGRPRSTEPKELEAALLPKARAELGKVLDFVTDFPRISIHLEAHTDNRKAEKSWKKLSKRRALAAKQYLVNKGISPNRIEIVAFGKDKETVLNTSPANWALNRRVEFKPFIKSRTEPTKPKN